MELTDRQQTRHAEFHEFAQMEIIEGSNELQEITIAQNAHAELSANEPASTVKGRNL